MTIEFDLINLKTPSETNLILGQSHFIKTVEDLYETLVSASAQIQFGLAFCEASGPCLVRAAGNDRALQAAAVKNAEAIAAGHSFIILMQRVFPVNVLNAVKQCPEVCRIYCATANPVQVITAKSDQGRGILGVIDGASPKGVEGPEEVAERQKFLRQIGYKLG
ncbi:MAG: adenosine-specific kinase [Elainellaceae cyanobacterium]